MRCRVITVRRFEPQDQELARAFILEGLREHWGTLDLTLNADLNDIATAYKDAIFLVAFRGDRLLATGALVPRSPIRAEIVRMSVARDDRRRGIGSLVLRRLLDGAKRAGFRQIILETTATWEEVVQFYLRHGFQISHYRGDDAYFVLDLDVEKG